MLSCSASYTKAKQQEPGVEVNETGRDSNKSKVDTQHRIAVQLHVGDWHVVTAQVSRAES